MKQNLLLTIILFSSALTLFSQPIYNEDNIRLYHMPSNEEIEWAIRCHVDKKFDECDCRLREVVIKDLCDEFLASDENRCISEFEYNFPYNDLEKFIGKKFNIKIKS